jgi:hypothetical protein
MRRVAENITVTPAAAEGASSRRGAGRAARRRWRSTASTDASSRRAGFRTKPSSVLLGNGLVDGESLADKTKLVAARRRARQREVRGGRDRVRRGAQHADPVVRREKKRHRPDDRRRLEFPRAVRLPAHGESLPDDPRRGAPAVPSRQRRRGADDRDDRAPSRRGLRAREEGALDLEVQRPRRDEPRAALGDDDGPGDGARSWRSASRTPSPPKSSSRS